MKNYIHQAAELIKSAEYLTAFTGAGISVESGIPPFRGENGIWNKIDPKYFELEYFYQNPKKSWELRSIVFKEIDNAKPNAAHLALAELEKMGLLKAIITQNIDSLHHKAGNKKVYEYHGNSREAICIRCGKIYPIDKLDLSELPPKCECGGILKPNYVFFGEAIPKNVAKASEEIAKKTDIMLVIGTTGIVYPASIIPTIAKTYGAKLIEINIEPSSYTTKYTDIFLQGKATKIMTQILNEIKKLSSVN